MFRDERILNIVPLSSLQSFLLWPSYRLPESLSLHIETTETMEDDTITTSLLLLHWSWCPVYILLPLININENSSQETGTPTTPPSPSLLLSSREKYCAEGTTLIILRSTDWFPPPSSGSDLSDLLGFCNSTVSSVSIAFPFQDTSLLVNEREIFVLAPSACKRLRLVHAELQKCRL